MRQLNSQTPTKKKEPGNALIEFVGIIVIIVGPALILIMSLSTILSARFSAEAAARDAVREAVRTSSLSIPTETERIAHEVWTMRKRTEPLTVDTLCTHEPCLTPGGQITVSVSAPVTLPAIGIVTHVEAHHTMTVDQYREMP